MTPEQFITIWKDNPLTERGGAQAHFDDLCDLLDVDKPRAPDSYCFERGAKKASGGDGWADVWKRGCFGWENKKPGRDLNAALKQLTDYALHLENPPLLVVSDREHIIIHTAFTGYPDEPRQILIDDLIRPSIRQILRWVFTNPEKLRPEKSTAAITGEAAGQFAELAQNMRERGLNGQQTAHFLVQCLFCMFAEDEELLPGMVFTNILENAMGDATRAAGRIQKLFHAMAGEGGEYGDHNIPWFNGGLFAGIDIPPLTACDLGALLNSARMDWRAIDPTIFGTLFERSLDPSARAPLGAHYTDTDTITKLIVPLVTEPLLTEWQDVKKIIAPGVGKGKRSKAAKVAAKAWQRFLVRLHSFRVLDPACGSGNFLYLTLAALHDVERIVFREAKELAGHQQGLWMQTGPHNILGIEINEYAAELARTTVWIGDIQWRRRNGRQAAHKPILTPLDGIQQRDALLNEDYSETKWPEADVIVGNPPFLGGNRKRAELGDTYFTALAKQYGKRIPPGADLVTYWFEKARAQIKAGKTKAAGLVATNSIRGGANRKVLKRITESSNIFAAWSDEPWVNEGAAVRVSLICFGQGGTTLLDGEEVSEIYPDLTAGEGLDLSKAETLFENRGTSFQGSKRIGPFDIPGELARQWLKQPNPNREKNYDVLKPSWIGIDVVRRNRDRWIIDFGTNLPAAEAALYEIPFQYVVEQVKPARINNARATRAKYWWRHGDPQPAMRTVLSKLSRYIVTPEVAKHRIFVFADGKVLPDCKLIVVARSDDTTFGILSSRFHKLWSLALGSWHGKGNDPRYTPSTTFETFPFPAGLTPADTGDGVVETEQTQAISLAAHRLDELRSNWLNPPEWVDLVITPEEEQAGFPKRAVPRPDHEKELKKRTLTNLYNQRPVWLDLAHKELDLTVAKTYGWDDYTPDTSDETILGRLLALNQKRAAAS